jgi:PII-like signaling protein
VVEIVDDEETIRSFLPRLDDVLTQGLVTVERVEIHRPPAVDDDA